MCVRAVFLCHTEDVEGKRYLMSDLGRLCFDGTHTLAVILALVVLAIYAVGFPAFILR